MYIWGSNHKVFPKVFEIVSSSHLVFLKRDLVLRFLLRFVLFDVIKYSNLTLSKGNMGLSITLFFINTL